MIETPIPLEQSDPELAELLGWVCQHNSKAERKDRIVVSIDHEYAAFATVVAKPTVGRNDPCPCGSGRKYKKCCG